MTTAEDLRTKEIPFLDVPSEVINNPIRLGLEWVRVGPTTLPPGRWRFLKRHSERSLLPSSFLYGLPAALTLLTWIDPSILERLSSLNFIEIRLDPSDR